MADKSKLKIESLVRLVLGQQIHISDDINPMAKLCISINFNITLSWLDIDIVLSNYNLNLNLNFIELGPDQEYHRKYPSHYILTMRQRGKNI